MKQIKIIKTFCFDSNFPDEKDFAGDYLSVQLIISENNTEVYNHVFGDYYHDKGEEKCNACVKMYKEMNKTSEIVTEVISKTDKDYIC